MKKSCHEYEYILLKRYLSSHSWQMFQSPTSPCPLPSPMVGARPGAGAPHPNPSSALRRSSGAGRDKTGAARGHKDPAALSTGTMPVSVQPSEEVYTNNTFVYLYYSLHIFDFNSVSISINTLICASKSLPF